SHSLLSFFFQAEDGIRYRNVTGVQTCALPIFDLDGVLIPTSKGFRSLVELERVESEPVRCISVDSPDHTYLIGDGVVTSNTQQKIGRASCRERVKIEAGAGRVRGEARQERTRA